MGTKRMSRALGRKAPPLSFLRKLKVHKTPNNTNDLNADQKHCQKDAGEDKCSKKNCLSTGQKKENFDHGTALSIGESKRGVGFVSELSKKEIKDGLRFVDHQYGLESESMGQASDSVTCKEKVLEVKGDRKRSEALASLLQQSENLPNVRKSQATSAEQSKDALIASLQSDVNALTSLVEYNYDNPADYYYSSHNAMLPKLPHQSMPKDGMPARHAQEHILQIEQLDFKPRLNTSSYVNVVTEPEEREVALLGLMTNLADASVYPASVEMHDTVVDMLAKLWHAPEPRVGEKYSGAGTVGSTEACLLAGLALKFRWRKWYSNRNHMSDEEVYAVRPNMVISTAFQAAWEKFFRYFDVDPIFIKPTMAKKFAIDASKMANACDEKTIGVVVILGNHYNGAYDPVCDVDRELKKMNAEKGYQVGIHVDAASGGFVAPFQVSVDGSEQVEPFDFRLDSVLSMSASGHKFGESICGTGWVVFRQRKDLAEHIAIRVTYLGGECDSMTLNFSRPASATYVQFYKFLRLGFEGYRKKVSNQMAVASYIRSVLRSMTHPSGECRFEILDQGDKACLPVVAARLNPNVSSTLYDDIDLQHALYESRWYVSGYCLSFENFKNSFRCESVCADEDGDATMFRIVCKSNLTMDLAMDLARCFKETLPVLDNMQSGYGGPEIQSKIGNAAKKRMGTIDKRRSIADRRKSMIDKRMSIAERSKGRLHLGQSGRDVFHAKDGTDDDQVLGHTAC